MGNNAVNIPVGLTVTDLLAGFRQGAAASAEFTNKVKQDFASLTTAAGSPITTLGSLNRALASTKQQISNTLISGGSVGQGLSQQFNTLSQYSAAAKQAFNVTVPLGPYQALNAKLSEAKTRMQDLLTSGKPVPAQLTAEYKKLEGQVNHVNGAFGRTGSGAGQSLAQFASGFLAVGQVFNLVKQGLTITSDFQRLDASLKAVSSSEADYARTQDFLRSTSDSLGVSYEALAESYKGLKAASNGTTLQGAATERIFNAVTRAGASLKLSNDEVKGSLLAIQQMMSKGTIQAEELRGQLGERLPGAFNIMARALNVTTPQLGKLLETGQVIAADVLPKFAAELEKTFGADAQQNVNTITGGFTRAGDQLELFVAEFSQSAGIDTLFAKIGNGIADTIAGMREMRRQGQGGFANLVGGVIGGLANNNTARLYENAARVRAEFSTLGADQQRARLELLQGQIANSRSAMEKYINTGLLADLRKTFDAARRGARVARLDVPVEVAPKLDIDETKKKLAAVDKQLQNLRLNHEAIPKSLQTEYDRLSAQVEAATGKVKKHKAAHADALPTLTVEESILKRLSFQFEQYGDSVDGSLGRQIRALRELVDQRKEALKNLSVDRPVINVKPLNYGTAETLAPIKDVVLGVKLDPVTVRSTGAQIKSIVDNYYKTTNLAQASFAVATAKNFLNPIQLANADLEKTRTRISEIRDLIATLSVAKVGIPTAYLDELVELKKKLRDATKGVDAADSATDPKGMDAYEAQFRPLTERIRETIAQMKVSIVGSLKEAATAAFVGMGEVVGGLIAGTTGINALPQALLGSLGGVLKQLGTIAIEAAIGLQAIKIAFETLNPAVALVAGVGLIALGTVIQAGAAKIGGNIKAFAQGGLVFGPTLGLVGEGIGTTRSNPEIIAPLDKLQQFIQPGGKQVVVMMGETRLEGTDLVTAYQRALDTRNYFK